MYKFKLMSLDPTDSNERIDLRKFGTKNVSKTFFSKTAKEKNVCGEK